MPKRPTDKQGIPCSKCFPTRHMKGREFQVYDTMFSLAWVIRKEQKQGKGPLIFSAAVNPWLLNALGISYRSGVDEAIDALLLDGWLVLLREGKHKSNGRKEPNEYQILSHDEYASAHPGSCRPYYFVPDHETGQALGLSRGDSLSSGTLPKNFQRKLKKYISDLSDDADLMRDEDRAFAKAIAEMWADEREGGGREILFEVYGEPEPDPTSGNHEAIVVPENSEVVPLRENTNGTAPEIPDSPLLENRFDHSGKTDFTATGFSGGSLLNANSPIQTSRTTTTTTPPATLAPRAWLSSLWSLADQERRDYEKYRSLKLRRDRASMADKESGLPASPDLLAIEELICAHGEEQVFLAWCSFAANPAPHCKPPLKDGGDMNSEATLYPVTVFLKHFDSYLNDGRADFKAYKESKGKDMAESSRLALNYKRMRAEAGRPLF